MAKQTAANRRLFYTVLEAGKGYCVAYGDYGKKLVVSKQEPPVKMNGKWYLYRVAEWNQQRLATTARHAMSIVARQMVDDEKLVWALY